MTVRSLLVGRRLPDLEREAFDRVAPDGATHPSQILYLTGSGHPSDRSRERWTEYAPSTTLRVQSLDRFVTDCFERDQYAGEETHVSRALLLRLVELGIENIESESNPLGATDRLHFSGFTRDIENLFSDLEFAGLLTPSEMHHAIDELGLTRRADHVRELAEAVIGTRDTTLDGELPETFRTERMDHVAHETDLEVLCPSVEAVVVGPLDNYNGVSVELLAAVAETWPTTALRPQHTTISEGETSDGASTEPTGVDRALDRPLEVYDRLGFDRERIDRQQTDDPTATLAASLYRHPADAPGAVDESSAKTCPATDDIDYCEPEDTQSELRYVARDVRERLADGTDADQIGVVLPSGTAYSDRLDELFEQYEIPHDRTADHQLTETHHGELVTGLCDLAAEPRTAETVLDVVTNPLVGLDNPESDLAQFDHRELARTADRVTATQLSAVRRHLDDETDGETDDAIQSLLDSVEELDETRLRELPDALDSLLRKLGVPEPTDDDESDFPSAFASREKRASETLAETVETLRLTADAADESIGTTTDRLERALHGVTVRGSGGPRDGSVTVCELGEAAPYEFAYTYCLGLTTDHLPSPTERSTFVRPIYDRHPDLSDDDPVAETRYHLAGNLTSAGRALLSVPQHDADGDSLVEADFVTELRRLGDLESLAVDLDGPRPGTAEDVQREIGRGIATAGDDGDAANRIVADAESGDSLTAPQADRLRAGVACAEARADSEFTPYDGRLTAETVELVRPADDREPYSPSRIERYANCGFKYYARHVLGIETPDKIEREPNYADRGTYVHDVLEAYYKSLQSWEGEPISAAGDAAVSDSNRADRLLEIALDQLDSAFAGHEDTPFQSSWLRKVLAGLGDPTENPYFRATPSDTASEDDNSTTDGLFARFLDNEATEIHKTTARPTWFEGRVGRPDENGTHLSDDPATVETPAGAVTLRGIIDRVDTVSERDPTGLVVRDYKTGSAPSERETLGGLAFQLPLYALMAEDALDTTETLGGAYYRVAPPGTVNSRSGLITSQEQAAYRGSDNPGTPMLRHSYPHFETHDAFRQFLDETVPARLGKIAEGIEQGRFQPTVLDPDDAGCEYCDYASVCDVRPHRRQDVIDHVETSDDEAYLPPLVRDTDLADVVEVN